MDAIKNINDIIQVFVGTDWNARSNDYADRLAQANIQPDANTGEIRNVASTLDTITMEAERDYGTLEGIKGYVSRFIDVREKANATGRNAEERKSNSVSSLMRYKIALTVDGQMQDQYVNMYDLLSTIEMVFSNFKHGVISNISAKENKIINMLTIVKFEQKTL